MYTKYYVVEKYINVLNLEFIHKSKEEREDIGTKFCLQID